MSRTRHTLKNSESDRLYLFIPKYQIRNLSVKIVGKLHLHESRLPNYLFGSEFFFILLSKA